jgi:hypothetical protein
MKLNAAATSGRPLSMCDCQSLTYTASKASASTCIGPEEIVDDSEEEREKIRQKLILKRRPIKREATITAGNLVSNTRPNSEASSDGPAGPSNTGRGLFRGSTLIIDEDEYKVDPYHTACADLSSLFKDAALSPSVSSSVNDSSVVAIRTPSPTASEFVPAPESPSSSYFVFVAAPDNSSESA